MSTKKDVQPKLNLDSDMYLSLAVELYEKGTWSKEVLIKRITLYAAEKNMDMNAVNIFLERLTKEKEYTLDEKRNFLSVLRLDGKELKYGDVAKTMSDEMVEKFYDMEVSIMDSDKVESYHDLANFKSNINASQEENIIEDVVEEKTENKDNENKQNKNDESQKSEEVHVINQVENTSETLSGSMVETETTLNDSKANKIKFNLGFDMPDTEEEFEGHALNIMNPENESSVRKITISEERLEKLKKTKNKAINFFLKTAIVVVAVQLLHPLYSFGSIVGYNYFASEIRNGKFNPQNPVGKAIKKVVETIMNIGIPNEEKENEKGGRTR